MPTYMMGKLSLHVNKEQLRKEANLMSVFKPQYKDSKTGKLKHTKTWYYSLRLPVD
jgi:hypothetical protein